MWRISSFRNFCLARIVIMVAAAASGNIDYVFIRKHSIAKLSDGSPRHRLLTFLRMALEYGKVEKPHEARRFG